jgi:hypothetical protein
MTIGLLSADPVPRQASATHRETITACLIVRNEEQRLPRALASVQFCDEVIVVDSGSTDRTTDIARAAAATVVENPWPGFGAQRNVAIDHSHGDWIVEVDADERITPRLRASIERFLAMPPPADVDMCALPLRDRLLGHRLGPSGKYPRYRARMFRRGTYRHDERRMVHEGLTAQGRVWAMDGDLDHELADSWREAIGDMWSYARLESGHVDALPSLAAYARAIVVRPATKFLYRVFVDGGWRDGPMGLARISLDVVSDSIVWTRRALDAVPPRAYAGSSHFGRSEVRSGPVRLVALASGDAAVARSVSWLRAARAAGADVALLADRSVDGGDWLDARLVRNHRPLELIRALDALAQMRRIDALVSADRRTPRLRLVPRHLRGAPDPLSLDDDPTDSVRRLSDSTERTRL